MLDYSIPRFIDHVSDRTMSIQKYRNCVVYRHTCGFRYQDRPIVDNVGTQIEVRVDAKSQSQMGLDLV